MSGSTPADAEQPSAADPSSRQRSLTTDGRPVASLRILLAELIDYAGLFPPAELSMRDAVESYAEHRQSADAWALGRFVVPVGRLGELADELVESKTREGALWRLSAIVGNDSMHDVAVIQRFNALHAVRAVVDAAEVRVASLKMMQSAIGPLLPVLTVFAEIPVNDQMEGMVTALAHARVPAKVRTGGVTPEAFPTSRDLARFLSACAAGVVPFKATAGLHHPLRADFPLTYEEGAQRATMFGFLNVFLAATLARIGTVPEAVITLLEERDASEVRFSDRGVSWRGRELSLDQLARTRKSFALSFGSCSFREPIEDLRTLSLL